MTGDGDRDGDGKVYSKSGENYLTMDYSRMVPLLVEAIKELHKDVETLTDTVKSQQKIIEELQNVN
jgi:chaperonin cofactor prefoldin